MFSGACTNLYRVKFKSVWHVRIRIFDNFLVSKRNDQKNCQNLTLILRLYVMIFTVQKYFFNRWFWVLYGSILIRLFIVNVTRKNFGKSTFFSSFCKSPKGTLGSGAKNPTFHYFQSKKCQMSDQSAPMFHLV